MEFIEAVGEHLVADLIWLTLVSIAVARGVFRTAAWPVFVMTVLRRGTTIRFSASALLRVPNGDDFVLVLTKAQGYAPAFWGPLGGVVKCKSAALSTLYAIDVQTDWLTESGEDMDRDLRVKMRGRAFWRFIRWFWSGKERESPSEAICRELKEELEEVGLPSLAAQVDSLEFDLVKTRTTGLFRQDDILHYRLFYILTATGPHATAFTTRLLEHSRPGQLEAVSVGEIERGAHDAVNVGGHSAFLLADGKYRHRTPSYQ